MTTGMLAVRCKEWVLNALGAGILYDRKERAMRILEEATELAQCEGVTQAEAAGIGERVFSRAVGEARQEMAGVYFTLIVYAWVRRFSLEDALVAELERVEDPALIKCIRAKHADKVAAGIGRPMEALDWPTSLGKTKMAPEQFLKEYLQDWSVQKPVCARIMPSNTPPELRRIGGPRNWCGKAPGHEGQCGDWVYGSQPEHAEAMNRRPK